MKFGTAHSHHQRYEQKDDLNVAKVLEKACM